MIRCNFSSPLVGEGVWAGDIVDGCSETWLTHFAFHFESLLNLDCGCCACGVVGIAPAISIKSTGRRVVQGAVAQVDDGDRLVAEMDGEQTVLGGRPERDRLAMRSAVDSRKVRPWKWTQPPDWTLRT